MATKRHGPETPFQDPFAPDGDPIAQRAATGLAKIGVALRHRTWRESGPLGLNPTQAEILDFLARGREEGVRLAEVASALAVTPATASDAVGSLEEKELVKKERSATDRRALSICLTPAGRQKAKQLAGWLDFLAESIAELPSEDQAAFLSGLTLVIRSLQEKGQIPVSRMCATCSYFRPSIHSDPERPHHCAFVDAPFGDAHLRLDCPDHEPADLAAD